jgi:sec-independent protein translocase protein TatC
MSNDVDETKMPLLDHLVELRRRLIYSVLSFFVCFVACFYFADPIFNFLVETLAELWAGQQSRRLIFTALHENFLTDVKVAFLAGAFISFPLISNQIWLFVAPGLYRNEKRAFLPFLAATPVLFLIGAAFVYYLVLPVAWKFFAGFEQAASPGHLAIELEPKVDQYLALVMQLIFAFGISFELPVLLTLLVRAGLTSSQTLRKNRRYAIVIAFVAAAILTPPDPLSQIGLAVPIILLYEISIWCGRLIERGREKREREDDI